MQVLLANRKAQLHAEDALQAGLGFPALEATGNAPKTGWLLNFQTSSVEDDETGQTLSAVACFFVCQDGSMFKTKVVFAPYLYAQVKDGLENEVEAYVRCASSAGTNAMRSRPPASRSKKGRICTPEPSRVTNPISRLLH